MKVKALVAGMAMVLGANGAHAAIATGASGTGPGELFLSVWDSVGLKSYSQDLGVNLLRFLTDSSYQYHKDQSWSVTLNTSVWGQFYNAGNNAGIVYNVAATDRDNGKLNALDQTYGYLTSFNTTNPAPVGGIDATSLLGPTTIIQNRAATYNGASPTATSVNEAKIWLPADQAYYATGWGDTYASQVPASQKNQGVLGQSLDVWFHGLFATLGQDDFENPIALDRWDQMPGQFQLTGTELKYTAATTVVPLPAAAWLMGSALLTLCPARTRASTAPSVSSHS